ncbi:MAG: hypothetical protein ABIP94_08380 [Planctomycetota bacterium]
MTATDPLPRTRRLLEVPLHQKAALDYIEVQALGLCAERTLRRLVTAGKVVRAVLRNGSRVKFLREVLIEELREAQS